MIHPLTKEISDRIDRLASVRRNEIKNSESNVVIFGKIYYVSEYGSDQNDGLTVETPWKTLEKVNSHDFEAGDAVLFHRGHTFRGRMIAKTGVTYSAYGVGAKPILCSSPYDGARFGKWIPTDESDIYRFSEKIYDDVGCMIFDGGRAYGLKATVDFASMVNRTDGKPFHSWRDLREDLSFYHDLGGPNIQGTEDNSDLYLKSTRGNPSDRFYSIEFNIRTNCIGVRGDNVRINNLCIKYCGCHGIGAGTVHGLTVDWCEFEWIGGSMQFYRDGHPTRFGNAVEIYGGCTDYTVENCYINQAYDAGITHQFSAGGDQNILMKDVTYKGNLIENCIYSIEYFNGKPETDVYRHMIHVRISDNIMRNSGYGFGKQRPDKTPDCHIKSWDHFNSAEDMIYENNIFDTGAHCLLHIACAEDKWMPVIRRNVFIQRNGGDFARLGATPTAILPYREDGLADQTFVGEDNVFYVKD